MQLLTHSRMECFKTCRKKHWFAYQQGLRRETDARALRMGSAYHAGLEALAYLGSQDAVFEAARRCYADRAPDADEFEIETVCCLLAGYLWRWPALTHEAAERSFTIPLLNPDTGRPSRTFQLAGKIDGIVRLEDGRLAVLEHKLLSDDLSSDSDLWRRLRIDQQISLYVYAGRRLGFDVDCVLYNVTRKPTIRPTDVPLLDDEGCKIVLDVQGRRVLTKQGKPRQTADAAAGYVLQTRPMTVEEWTGKLMADLGERPEWYYQRCEVPRLDDELREFEHELWEIAQTVRETQASERHYRTVSKNTCPWCEFFELCTTQSWNPKDGPPEGFVLLADVHPELHDGQQASPDRPA